MLNSLDPIFEVVARLGWGIAVHLIGSPFLTAALVAVFFFRTPRMSGRAAYALSPIATAGFAQAMVLSDLLVAGGALFALSFVGAVHFGRIAGRENGDRSFDGILRELPYLLLLVVFAGALRLFALEEIPWFVDVEPGAAFVQSLSPHGLARYVTDNRVLDDGFVHMVGRWLTGHVVGPSIISLRLTGVVFGVVSVVLCYFMARLVAPRLLAGIAAALLASDSAHLFWSRIEASQIVASSSAAFIGGLLGLWLIRTWSIPAAVATMFWIPATRYFYAGTLGLAVLPGLLVVAGIWRRESRFRTLRVASFCLVGSFLWLISSTGLQSVAVGEWEFVSPFKVYGRSLYYPHDPENRYVDLFGIDVVKVQAQRLAKNAAGLVAHMAHGRPRFSNWLIMAQPDPDHMRSVSAGVFAILVPSLGFLLGAASSAPSSVAVLLWLVTLSIPGLFSVDPEPRRVVGLMAGIYVAIAMHLECVVRFLKEDRHALWFRDGLVLAAIALSLSGIASHLLTGKQETGIGQYIGLMAPVFRNHDAVFHNIDDAAVAATLVFGNSHAFATTLPCFAFLAAEGMVTHDSNDCSFDSGVYQDLLPVPAIANRREHFRARRVAFVLEMIRPEDFSAYSALREKWPAAKVTVRELFLPPRGLTSITVLSIRGASAHDTHDGSA